MTRIGVLSDSHGDWRNLERLISQMGHVDAVCFLGDIDRDADHLQELLGTAPDPPALFAVCGNNDLASLRPYDLLSELGGKRIFMTHGHRYRVRQGTDELVRKAKSLGAEVALYGHTHEAYCSYDSGILAVNPGAAGNPWGGRIARGAMLTIADGRMRVSDVVAGW